MLNREIESKIKEHSASLEQIEQQKATKMELKEVEILVGQGVTDAQINNAVQLKINDGSISSLQVGKDSIKTLNLKNENVTSSKIENVVTKGNNLLNKLELIDDIYLDVADGSEKKSPIGYPYMTSDFIKIKGNTNYASKGCDRVCFYDELKIFINGMLLPTKNFTTAENAKYIRISVEKKFYDTAMIHLGTNNNDLLYEGYYFNIKNLKVNGKNILKRSINKNHLNFNIPEFITGKNKFNKNNVVSGFYVNYLSGILIKSSTAYPTVSSELIEVKPNTNYTKSGGVDQMAFYDEDLEYITGYNLKTVTSPSNAKYMIWTVGLNSIDTTQIEEGDISTEFEEYKILMDNSDIYDNINKISELNNKYEFPSTLYRSIDVCDYNLKNGYSNSSSNLTGSTSAYAFTTDSYKWTPKTSDVNEYVEYIFRKQQKINTIQILLGSNYTRIPILYLHRTVDGTYAINNNILTYLIENLKANGFTFIKMSEAISYLEGGTLPTGVTKPIVLGADDGYVELYNNTFAVIKNTKVPLNLWMLTGYCGIDEVRHTDSKGLIYMSRNDVLEMINSGFLEIHSHTDNLHGSSVTNKDYYLAPSLKGHILEGREYDVLTGKYQSQQEWEIHCLTDIEKSINKIRSFPNQSHKITLASPNHISNSFVVSVLRKSGIIGQVNTSLKNKNVKGNDLYKLSRIELDNITDTQKADELISSINYDSTDVTRTATVGLYTAYNNKSSYVKTHTLPASDGVVYNKITNGRTGYVDNFSEIGAYEDGFQKIKLNVEVSPVGKQIEIEKIKLFKESTDTLDINITNNWAMPFNSIDGGASLPSNPLLYQEYFYSTINKKIIWNGTNWVDAIGNIVS